MPIQYKIDPALALVICTAEGMLTRNDLRDFDHRFRNDPEIVPELDQLIDITKAEIMSITAADIREMVGWEPVLGPSSHRAFVAHGDLAFGLMRMFELYRGGSSGKIRFFNQREEAGRWLEEMRTSGARSRAINRTSD